MTRVGIDIRDLKIARTGVKTWTTEMIKALEQHAEIKLIKLDNNKSVYTGENIFLKISEHIRFFWWKAFALPLMAYRNECDWVICADFFSPLIKLRFKTILVLHDAFFWEYPEHYNPIWRLLFKAIGGHGIRQADLIITPSNHSKKQLILHTKLKEEKFHVVYEACRTFPQPSSTRPFSAPYLLHIGVLEKRKNLPRLIRAFHLIANHYPDLCLVLAGNSPNKFNINDTIAIQESIAETGLSDRVYLTGHVSDQMASDLYKYAEVYVFPSYNEGFGLPVLEAFQFGLPVAAAENSALPEIGGNALILFDPNDVHSISNAIEKILNEPELRKKMIEKGFVVNKEYSWQKAADQLYELMINKKI